MNERKYTTGIHLATKTSTKKRVIRIQSSHSDASIKSMAGENITRA